MGLQVFRADERRDLPDGSAEWLCNWMGGPTLSKVENCQTPFGRRTVYVTGHADTYFTLPAACRFRGKDVRGFLTFADGVPEFHANRDGYWFPRTDREVT